MLTNLQRQKSIKLFSMYDVNNNGTLQLDDLEIVVYNLATIRSWNVSSGKCKILLEKFAYEWMRLKGQIDVDRDGKISLDEWLAYHEKILVEQRQNTTWVSFIFDALNEDMNGHLCKKEWQDLFKAHHIPTVYVDEIFAKLDADGNGYLSKEEVIERLNEFYFSNDPTAIGNCMFGAYTW